MNTLTRRLIKMSSSEIYDNKSAPPSQSGFSLIEIIGVMAIIAILLTAAVPNVMNLIKNERYDAEEVTVDEVGAALQAYIENRHIIPDSAGWADSLAPYIDLSSSQLRSTVNGSRRLIIHPNFYTARLPRRSFNQDSISAASGIPITSIPTQAQVLIVSNLYEKVPFTSFNTARFEAVWNQSGSIPNGFKVNDSVSIRRVSLNSSFYPVTFNTSSAPATYAVNSTKNTDAKPWPTAVETKYLLKNTRIYTRKTSGGDITGSYLSNQSITLGAPPSYEGSSNVSSSSTPSSSSSSSVVVSSSSSSRAACLSYPNWSSRTTYRNNANVRHSGRQYRSKNSQWGNRGNPPGVSTWFWTDRGVCR